MDKRNFLARNALQVLIDELSSAGYRVLGPRLVDGAIQFVELETVSQLPTGTHDQQSPGRYRLTASDSPRCFAWANGPQGLKPLTFSADEILWRAGRNASGTVSFQDAHAEASQAVAVLGARACDLAALRLHDQHFLERVEDPCYATRRKDLFLVAVHCSHPADTCFCSSTGDGPGCNDGYDLVLNELDDGYLVAAGSARGEAILPRLPLQPATQTQCDIADAEVAAAAERQHRTLPAGPLYETLFARLDHPRWQTVAERCLSCGNCTSVCPSCFCHSEHDEPMLGGTKTEHHRVWDSCFSEGHSYLHGFVIRPETGQRYRQWLTHKLGSWHQQYGRSGCVGCGRCITWCPVGIDITEEAHAICGDAQAPGEQR